MATRFTFLATAAAILAGCVSGYKTNYQPAEGATPDRIAALRATAPAEPKLELVAGELDAAFYAGYVRRGYVAVGQSRFTSPRGESNAAALEQGRAVGADIVAIVTPTHAGTLTTHIPFTVPTTTTVHNRSTVTAWRSGGSVSAVSNATTTVQGTQTNIIPVTVNHTNFAAVYFVKGRVLLGVVTRVLNDAERARLQSNRGLVVTGVIDISPAYNSDVLVGDIMLTIDGLPLATPDSILPLLDAYKGKTVRVKLNRAGTQLEKDITIGS